MPHTLGSCVPITLVEVVREKLEMREENEAIEGSNKLRGLQVGEGAPVETRLRTGQSAVPISLVAYQHFL